MQYIRIPEERISVLIGVKGVTKRQLEKMSDTKLTIEDNEVTLEGDSINEWKMKDVVQAIGRGFNPEKAMQLLSDEYTFHLIELDDAANSQKSLNRIRGRIIGENARTRKYIERATNTLLSIYGKTVSIIGGFDDVELARQAIQMLLAGSRHTTVYKFLEKQSRQKKAVL